MIAHGDLNRGFTLGSQMLAFAAAQSIAQSIAHFCFMQSVCSN